MVSKSEIEKPIPDINWLGRLDGGQPKPNVWRGKISAGLDVIKNSFGLDSEQEATAMLDGLKQKVVEKFAPADESAQVRCIDGRGEDEAPQDDNTGLGPQVPGGTPVMAVAWRLAQRLEPGIGIDTDLDTYKGKLAELELPFLPGAHEDEHNADHPENTGCGAIDKMLDILKAMGDREAVYAYTKAIAGDFFSDESFEDIQVKLEILNSSRYSDRYFNKDEINGGHRFRNRIVSKIKDTGHQHGRKTVEKLCGEHNEVFLIVNKAHRETFDRDGFSAITDNKAQAFNYDFWHVVERAQALFPDDAEQQKTMIVANAMYAVGTAMILTDGSLELGVRE